MKILKKRKESNILAKKIFDSVLCYEKIPYRCSTIISIVDKKTIRKINKKERGIDKVTDVLSFPNIWFDKPSKIHLDASVINYDNDSVFLGEVIICRDKIYEQAKAFGHSIIREYSFLLTHSFLHLLGYDHMDKKDEKKMFDKQEKILDLMGIYR